MPHPYTHRYSITAANMNKNYRLNADAILLYYQDCWARYMSCQHVAAFDIVKEQKMWVVTEAYTQMEPGDNCWSEEMDFTVWNSEVTPTRLYSDFRVSRADNGALIAQGYACWTLLNTVTKRIERADDLLPQLTIIPDLALETHKKRRMPAGNQVIAEVKHKVNRLDLDFNGHVNNRSYLSIAMLTAPDDFLNHNTPRYFCVHWLRETYLDETIHCVLQDVAEEPISYLHTLSKNDGTVVAQILSHWQPAIEEDIATHLQRQ